MKICNLEQSQDVLNNSHLVETWEISEIIT